ncbi:hypothetical protein CR513_36279, partial [Mucuna pruriens]
MKGCGAPNIVLSLGAVFVTRTGLGACIEHDLGPFVVHDILLLGFGSPSIRRVPSPMWWWSVSIAKLGVPHYPLSQSNFVVSIPRLAETNSDRSLPRPYRLSFYREQLGQYREELTTKNELYQIGAVAGDTSSFVSLCAKLSEVKSRVCRLGQMENNDRMLKELATPDVVYQPWCIQYPQLEPAQTYELKS